jgi:hypothetical protein
MYLCVRGVHYVSCTTLGDIGFQNCNDRVVFFFNCSIHYIEIRNILTMYTYVKCKNTTDRLNQSIINSITTISEFDQK